MSLTLGLTGMDPATEAALKAAFADANERLDGHWTLLPESEAAHVVVDMDSMYGPMSWLRLHAAGKRVIGLTTASRTQTDFRLGRPFDAGLVAALLHQIADDSGFAMPAAKPAPPPAPVAAPTPAAAPAEMSAVPAAPETRPAATPHPHPSARDSRKAMMAELRAAQPSGMTPAPAPFDQLPEEVVPEASAHVPEPLPDTSAAEVEPPALAAPHSEAPMPEAPPVDAPRFEAAPFEAPLVPPRPPGVAQFLEPGALRGRVRHGTGKDAILIDAERRLYHGPLLLKPLAGHFEGSAVRGDFIDVDEATWTRESATAGPAQPLLRLQWLGGLLAGNGSLLPGHDVDGRYQLAKWPQTEREFPKHFRIATAMMKGPATVAQIAQASGIVEGEVADFINANLVTGFAELVPETPIAPPEPPKPTGLLGRFRR